MKNNILLIVITLLVTVAVSSCKKNVQTCKLGKYYLSDGSSTPAPNVFSYYQDGRLKRIVHSDGAKDTLAYNADTLTVLSYDNTGLLIENFTGLLNASGSVTAGTKTSYDISGTVTGTDYLLFEYNASGNLTKETTNNTSGATILALAYDGANTATGTLHVSGFLTKKYFFYHSTAANKTGIDDLTGEYIPYLGKPSGNLLDSIHIIQPATSDTTRIQYSHTLDNNEYLSKTIQTWLTPGVQTKYHTYQYFDCN